MAIIAPFRGLRYNQVLIKNMEDVITPPWDVISPEEQNAYYERHPCNMIRLILGKTFPQDNQVDNRYTRAAHFFKNWQREGILIKDDQPSLYLYEIEYSVKQRTRKRCGFISLVKLEDFGEGQLFPHEMMYSSAKLDRLTLLEKCHAHFSPVFALYSDPKDNVIATLHSGIKSKPLLEFEDLFHVKHRLWGIQEKGVINDVALQMKDKALLIADGHHRYKAALDYRNNIRARYPHAGEMASFNYVMMYLCNLYSPGLVILPVHRLISKWVDFNLEDFLGKAEKYFKIKSYKIDKDNKHQIMRHFYEDLKKMDTSFGMYVKQNPSYYTLTSKKDLVESAQDIRPDFRELDVAIFTHFVLERILGLEPKDMDNEGVIQYTPHMETAIKLVDNGSIQAAFLLNPTKVEHVHKIASKGLTMPHKSTYFYPKVMAGLVIHKIDLW
ncbi:MAG TPA: DUF1015 domain-containing protein [Syntrophaceae bacterium]|nr:DUF1015 domain-containing protein [Syntrophaceae bacterium]